MNEMKKLMNLWLMAALLCGLGMSVTSCKDNDDDNTSEQRNEDADPMDTDDNMVAWRWLSLLTDAQALDYVEEFYDVEHTLSPEDTIESLGTIARRNGGHLA